MIWVTWMFERLACIQIIFEYFELFENFNTRYSKIRANSKNYYLFNMDGYLRLIFNVNIYVLFWTTQITE